MKRPTAATRQLPGGVRGGGRQPWALRPGRRLRLPPARSIIVSLILGLLCPSPARADGGRERRREERADRQLVVEEGRGAVRPLRIEPFRSRFPANHLKFYLQFREPMERGDVFRHLRLVEIDPAGSVVAEVPDPFRDVELWDETFTRMTLWLHPGRQKPGVNLNVEIGPILEEGKLYRLEVSPLWRTEAGEALGTGTASREFYASAADESQPDPSRWRISASKDGSLVSVETGESLDPISALTSLSVERSDGSPVEGLRVRTVDGAPHATRIELRCPEGKAWPPGSYRLMVAPKIEDLAGNSVARPFNLDRQRQPDFQERTGPVPLPFTIAPR